MDENRRISARRLFFSAFALVSFWGLSHGEYINEIVEADLLGNSIGEVAHGTRALKSMHKIPEVGAVFQLLSAASSEVVHSLALDLACAAAITEKRCSKRQGCSWKNEACSSRITLVPSGLKQCMGNLAVLLDDSSANEACKIEFTSSSSCNTQKNCTWSADKGTCVLDALAVLTNIPSVDGVPEGSDEIGEDFLEWLVTRARSDGILTTNDPDEILAWEPGLYLCPDATKRLACDMVKSTLETRIATFYCVTKFRAGSFSPSACNADPLCGVDKQGDCWASLAVQEKATLPLWLTIASYVEDPFLRLTLEFTVKCAILEKADCVDECVWDGAGGVCVSNRIAPVLGKISRANPAPVCQIFGAVLESGCVAVSADQCTNNPRCKLDQGGQCAPKEKFFKEVMGDTGVRKAFNRVDCKKRKSKKACP